MQAANRVGGIGVPVRSPLFWQARANIGRFCG